MFGIRYIKLPPTTFVLQYQNGQVMRDLDAPVRLVTAPHTPAELPLRNAREVGS